MSNKLKISLLMNKNSYSGREYLYELLKREIKVDAIQIGKYPEIDDIEEKRCGGLWQPKKIKILKKLHNFYFFSSLDSKNLLSFLKKMKYDICIQGGTGLINKKLISSFNLGIINFHPGDLPYYRGSSAPEWQLWENKPIVSTCHLVDEGIDSGPIFEKRVLKINTESYFSFRASIYPETAKFVGDVIQKIQKKIINKKDIIFTNQNNLKAKYRKYIGQDKILKLIKDFSN